MKKLLALILAVMMIATLSITAFADSTINDGYVDADGNTKEGNWPTDGNGTSTGAVNVQIGDQTTQALIYYVEVSWKTMTFTFVFNDGANWNPETHSYNSANGAWQADAENGITTEIATNDNGNKASATMAEAITVKNHSNDTISIAVSHEYDGDFGTTSGVEITVSLNAAYTAESVGSAEGTPVNNPPKVAYDVKVSGAPNADTAFKLGTITVTISKGTTASAG